VRGYRLPLAPSRDRPHPRGSSAARAFKRQPVYGLRRRPRLRVVVGVALGIEQEGIVRGVMEDPLDARPCVADRRGFQRDIDL
jgi:hypothetical protein